ncbi:Flagellar L-ring protein, partial [Frankliniella fusca]
RFSGTTIQDSKSVEGSTALSYLDIAGNERSVLDGKRLSPWDLKLAAAKLSLNSGREHVSFSGKIRKARQARGARETRASPPPHPRSSETAETTKRSPV